MPISRASGSRSSRAFASGSLVIHSAMTTSWHVMWEHCADGRTMADKFNDPLLTPKDVARHLRIPTSTLYYWLGEEAGGAPLVHRVAPERRGWPSVPFVAVVEAYVLRSLRDLGLTKRKIRDAAAEVRTSFHTPYALATR